MKMWLLVGESVLMVVLWITCVAMDTSTVVALLSGYRYLGDGITFLIFLVFTHLVINCWLIRIVIKKFTKLGILLFLTLQIPLFLLFRGAWHGLQACCVQGQRHKTYRALKAKYSVCCETKSSSEKIPVEDLEHREASCISSHNGEVPGYIPTIPLPGETPEVTSDIERGAETPIKITKTKFVKDTNKIEMNPDDPVEIYGGEPSIYKYTVRCLQSLFADKKSLSYHFVMDSTNTRILHVSCTGKTIGSLPDRIISENPRVICSDTHYVLNLTSFNGYEVYSITKRSSSEVTSFSQMDLSRMIWLPVWPLAVIKIYDLKWKLFHNRQTHLGVVWVSLVVGLVTWLATQRTLYHSITDRLLITGLRLLFYVVRTILLCSLGVLYNMLLIPIGYLSAKAAGALFFCVYIVFKKATRNVELFTGAFDKYAFCAMYDPMVQVGESLVYCAWAISLYCTTHIDSPPVLYVLLTTIIGQTIGLGWIWFVRPRLRQPLCDPALVLGIIKQMEYARL